MTAYGRTTSVMLLWVILIGLVTHAVSESKCASVSNEDEGTPSLRSEWWANLLEKHNNSIIDEDSVEDSAEDSVEETTKSFGLTAIYPLIKGTTYPQSPKVEDLKSISYAILNFFNAINGTNHKEVSKTHLKKIYDAIDVYFYDKNNNANFGDFVDTDQYLEEVFTAILNYRDHKLHPENNAEIDIEYYLDRILAAIKKYKDAMKKKYQEEQRRLQEELRIRLQTILEILERFFQMSQAGNAKYKEQLDFLEEVFKLLLKYKKYRLNHQMTLSTLDIIVHIQAEDTLRIVLSSIEKFKKLKANNPDSKQIEAALDQIFTKVAEHLKRVTINDTDKSDVDNVVLLVFRSLVRFYEIIKKPAPTEILKVILNLLIQLRQSRDPVDKIVIDVFKALLTYYQQSQPNIAVNPFLNEIFVAILNYVNYANLPVKGPNINLEKVFAAIEIYLNGHQVVQPLEEFQILHQILDEILRYETILQSTYLNEILVLLLNFKNAVTERPVDNNDVLDKLFQIIISYFQTPSQNVNDKEIQQIINLIIIFINNKKLNDDSKQSQRILKELFNLIIQYIKQHQNDPNQNDIVKTWLQILKILIQFYNPNQVVTERIIDVTIYLRKILNELVNEQVLDDQILLQALSDLANVYNFIDNDPTVNSNDWKSLKDILGVIAIYIQTVQKQTDLTSDDNLILLEDVFYAIQLYISERPSVDHEVDYEDSNVNVYLLNQIFDVLLNHHQSKRTPESTSSRYLDAIFLIIRREQHSPPRDIITAVLRTIFNTFHNNQVDYLDPSFTESMVLWKEIFIKISYGNNNLPLAYLKQIFRLLIEHMSNPVVPNPNTDQLVAKIIDIVVKYQNHKDNHPLNVIVIYEDNRPVWIQIIDVILKLDNFDINKLDPKLKQLFEFVFRNVNNNSISPVNTLIKILLNVYNIVLKQETQNQGISKSIAIYLNLISERINGLFRENVTDEKVIIAEIIKVILLEIGNVIPDLDVVVDEVIDILQIIRSGKPDHAIAKIIKLVFKVINLTGRNIIKVLFNWLSVLDKDAETVLVRILLAIMNMHEYDQAVIDPAKARQILTILLNKLFHLITSRDLIHDDLRQAIVEVIKNFMIKLRPYTNNPHAGEFFDVVIKLFDNEDSNRYLNWDDVVKILVEIDSELKPGKPRWQKMVETMKMIIAGSNTASGSNPWIEIGLILNTFITGKEVEELVQIIQQLNHPSAGENEAVYLINIIKTVIKILKRSRNVGPEPLQQILTLIIRVFENPRLLTNEYSQLILNILSLLAIGNHQQDPGLQQVLNIIVKIIEKPQSETSRQRINEILKILKFLIQENLSKEVAWKDILKVVVSLLSDPNAISGDPWEEIILILKPLLPNNPELGPNVLKILELIIEILNSKGPNVDGAYQELLKILSVLLNKKSGSGNDLQRVIKLLINFLKGTDVRPDLNPVITGIIQYLELVLSENGRPIINPHKDLKLLTQTVITVDKYINVADLDTKGNNACCGLLQKLLKERPTITNSHYSYIENINKPDKQVLAKIIQEEMARKDPILTSV